MKQEAAVFGSGLRSVPKAVIRPKNLAWELPLVTTTVVLIEIADTRTADSITSKRLATNSDEFTNIGLAVELGSGAAAWLDGCHHGDSHVRAASFTALSATAEAGLTDLATKLAFDRQLPNGPGVHSTGDFWGGGRAFPSGHSATSFAFAAAMAHEYPQQRWLKWTLYGLAGGISAMRVPAKHHFPSDVLFGSALGYVIGTYAAQHDPLR